MPCSHDTPPGTVCREAEVLSMFAMVINKLKSGMVDHVPAIFNATFECTLNMIKGNYVDYPEHRLQFFSLLQAITNHTFNCLRTMLPHQQQLLIDSIVWAFRHTERNVADTGLSLLNDLILRFIQERDLLGPFCQAYYCRLLGEIFAVMTDTMHKPGFRQQVRQSAAAALCCPGSPPVRLLALLAG
jgi:exportin-1